MHVVVASMSSALLDCLGHPGSLGIVHSVFDRALNIRLNDSPRILALTFSPAGGLPYALTVADGCLESFVSAGIMTGQVVELSAESRLKIEAAGVWFDYTNASIWNPHMGKLSDPQNIPAFLDLLDWASDQVFVKANQAGLVPLLREPALLFEGTVSLENTPSRRVARLAVPFITGLLTALRQGDASGLRASSSKLLGFGIGGTPSGDDLLVGMLAALRRSSSPQAKRMLDQLSSAIASQLGEEATSLLSLTVLRHALAWEFSEKIHEVTRQLMHPDNIETLEVSLEKLLMHGATSGTEMFLGVCLGFLSVYGNKKGDDELHPGI
jgi:hypothetical protein